MTMHIGLIVGVGPAATESYYRALITGMASVGVELELTMVHADAPTPLDLS
jgi:aspartate racemase